MFGVCSEHRKTLARFSASSISIEGPIYDDSVQTVQTVRRTKLICADN